jgi:A/G-specific adenine glycosylase
MSATNRKMSNFSRILLEWSREKNVREMPWKGEKDPYKIWLSEIILQQTRVEQGLAYYNNFVKEFPNVDKLANAQDEKVFKLWEGLGYYTRCRNLIAASRYISRERNGKFPDTYEEIVELKGVGPYTAAAISSFAFNLPHAVVDGNVFRVLARVFGIDTPIDSAKGKKEFAELANKLLDKKEPGPHNQAIMDFGATICKPVPLCNECVFKKSCLAFLNNTIADLPVKEKKTRIKKRWFYYLVIDWKNTTAVRQRTEKDIWQLLYEFPLIETENEQHADSVAGFAEKNGLLNTGNYQIHSVSPIYRQQLSHQLIIGRFITISLKSKPAAKKDWQWMEANRLGQYAFPKLINQYRSTTKKEPLS